jgi:hypothetical protein
LTDDLSEMFGIDLADPGTPTRAPARQVSTRPPTVATATKSQQTRRPNRRTGPNREPKANAQGS